MFVRISQHSMHDTCLVNKLILGLITLVICCWENRLYLLIVCFAHFYCCILSVIAEYSQKFLSVAPSIHFRFVYQKRSYTLTRQGAILYSSTYESFKAQFFVCIAIFNIKSLHFFFRNLYINVSLMILTANSNSCATQLLTRLSVSWEQTLLSVTQCI